MATKPGERKQQILETLAKMLETPKREKITTAALAAKLDVSEAALYRHFAGKAQMFEGLIEFIEQSLFGLVNKITGEEQEGLRQVRRILTVMLLFAEKNPGMTRVLIGDALVNEDDRLQLRINQLFDRVESTLKQSLRIAETQTGRKLNPEAQANLLICFVIGRWQQFAKSGFKRKPMEFVQEQLTLLYGLEE
ncbi:nucleoid occlusion factor SlmA [Methylobacillus sp. MM3]|jgi:TetR/AcrR family transcriptional regulator|uniref:nucleoid occlusion factor SlmA n=1 Tax=Methylobacillus sp. MM3 TaxID=1848039 RepID=UPI0007E05AFB|nr:nucleoid occlusion factor SlmA [Methylobacillus sp. MM3]OAJ70765.1 nucleoid occlusion factor SlmA [Methylobacillus sp. MM3]